MTTVRILQLYPELLSVTGDRGTIDVLRRRAEQAGLGATCTVAERGDTVSGAPDLVVIGNGPLSALATVHSDLIGRRDWLADHIAAGGVVWAVGGGAEMLGRSITGRDGRTLAGLDLLPMTVTRTRERHVGYIVAETPDGRLVGFEDHASRWDLDEQDASHLRYGRVVAGDGSIPGEPYRYETVRRGGVWATNVQGPALPLNPWLADLVLSTAFARVGTPYTPGVAHEVFDGPARAARADIERLATSHHFTSIPL